MVSDTRSARKIREELDKHGSKQQVSMRKDSLLQSPGNTVKASTPQRMTTSPLNVRKSKRLGKEVPPSTPVKRTSERLGKCDTPNSSRRAAKGKKDASSSSASKESARETMSKLKKKKEKTLTQVTRESKKAELDLEVVGMKRKRMNGRRFKALFKGRQNLKIAPDGDNELERSEKLVDVCSDNVGCLGSLSMEDTEDVGDDCSKRMVRKLKDESINKTFQRALQDSTLRDDQAEVRNDINVDNCFTDNFVGGCCSKYAQTKSSIRGMSDNPEKSPTNSSSTECEDAFESSLDGSISACKRFIYHEEDAVSASLVCENCNLERTCLLCSKSKWVGYDLPAEELCFCNPVDDDLVNRTTCKARSDLEAAVTLEPAREVDCGHPLIKRDTKRLCGLCNKAGDLLCCEGKSCIRQYHLSCLDPPLTDALPGVWHCPQCVKKKLLFGVHSVSDGVESIWDARQVEVPNAKGVRQRQFLVKYCGLAHVHNHWVPEHQLILKNPHLVSNFFEKDQIIGWNAEWMVPHRLLWKRPVQEKICVASTSVIWVCEYEWLVKWRGLTYDHATWELDTAEFLRSSLGQDLVKGYEMRRGKAKQKPVKHCTESSIVGHSETPASRSHADENHNFKNVNKLREFLLKCPNAVVFDDQEGATSAILFIHSMIETFRPFLIVTTYDSLSRWEADFERLVPSVDVVVYSGSRDTRKMIRSSEFHDEGGCMMVQVLLSSAEDVLEDLEILRCIRWKAIVIDEYQYCRIANGLEKIKMLSTDMRILLVGGQIKDAISEYLKILSFVEPHAEFDKLRSLKSETNDNLSKLKDRLSHFIAYGRPSQVSKFIEYWVPVQISNLQLEHYCATLLSNSNALCSCSTKDPVGILPEILRTLRKCCYHPYLVDPSVQARLIADKHPAAEILDTGIKASGKLQLLDMMLTEIKARGLQVLILFQLIGSGPLSTGNILHDFLFQRFGLDTYERVDAAYSPYEKQAAVNRFNTKETKQFVFLLENRACSSLIKLSSLDAIIIYDSDWNPANDLRALNKLSVDSKNQIKIFRLYTSFTIEERALVLAKQNVNLDHNSQYFNRSTSNALLSWGVTYLFSKLDEYHADSSSNSALNFSSGQLLMDEVMELKSILAGNLQNSCSESVISEAKLDVGSYNTNTPTFGESKVQLKDGEAPHVFWRNLFEGKSPHWKHLMGPSPRNRKRVHYWEGSLSNSEVGKDNTAKKRRKMVNESSDPTSGQDELVADEVAQVTTSNGGSSKNKTCNQIENFHRDDQSSLGAEVSVSAASKERIVSSDEQRSIHNVLQREMKTLCQTLKLSSSNEFDHLVLTRHNTLGGMDALKGVCPFLLQRLKEIEKENVIQVAELFLEYVTKNHHVNSTSRSIVQAFQIAVCWVAASITKQKIDKKESLILAKQLLHYQCTQEEANSVYSKMRSLKKMYMQCSGNITCLRGCLLGEEDLSRGLSTVNRMELQCSYEKENMELEIEEYTDKELAERQILTQQNVEDKVAASEMDRNEIKKIKKKCYKQMKKLIRKHQVEIEEFLRIWADKEVELEKDHKLKSAVIRSIHGQAPVGMEKLKVLYDDFKKEIKDYQILKDVQLKKLEGEHLTVINEEKRKVSDWLAKAKASSELRAINGQNDAGGPQSHTSNNICSDGDKLHVPDQHLENEDPNKSSSTQGNDANPFISPIRAPPDAACCETPVGNFVNSENEVGVESFEIVELRNQSENSSDDREAVTMNLLAVQGHVSNEIQSFAPTELPVVPETVPGETEGNDQPRELSYPSEQESSQRGEAEVATSKGLHGPGQPLLYSEQIIVAPGSSDLLTHKDSDALDEENQSGQLIKIAKSRPTDYIAPAPSNCESPVTDDIVTPEPSNKAPVSLSVDVSLSCNQLPATGDHDQGRNPPQTAEPERPEIVLHESTPQIEDNLENAGPSTGVSGGQNAELPVMQNGMAIQQEIGTTLEMPNHAVVQNDKVATISKQLTQAVLENDAAIPQEVVSTSQLPAQSVSGNDVAIPLEVTSTSEQPHQPVPQVVAVEANNLHELGTPVNQNHQSVSLLPDPLQIELERMHKETQHMEKNLADMTGQLKSDCEKELEEVRKKYEVKLQEIRDEFKLKRNEHDKNQKKLLLNKMLADAFRSKCLETRPRLQGLQHGIPSFMLPAFNISSPRAARSPLTTTPAVQTIPQQSPSPGPPPSRPALSPLTTTPAVQTIPRQSPSLGPPPSRPALSPLSTTPAVQTIPQLSRSHSMRPSPVAIRNLTTYPVQGAQHAAAAALASGCSARHPVIGAFTPSTLGSAGKTRSVAPPHLQSCRPAVGAPVRPETSSSGPAQTWQLPSPPGFQSQPPPPPLDSVGLQALPVPNISSTFHSLEQSDLELLGNAPGNQTSAAVDPDVVCLSDDE